jgi:protein-tyrosine kinase
LIAEEEGLMEELARAMERFKSVQGARRPGGFEGERVSAPSPIVYHKTRQIECHDAVLRRHRVVAAYERGPYVESYQFLRTQVLHRLRERQWNVVGVTSPRPQEGKSLTALNLAAIMAMEATQTVLAIDADLRSPSLHRLLGLDDVRGLSDYLLEDVPLEELLIHPGLGRLVVLPGGRPILRSAEALTSPSMTALMAEVKHRYPSRVVIVDLPPILDRADVHAFAPALDALLVVVDEGRTRRAELREAIEVAGRAIPLLGTVLNRVGRDMRDLKRWRALAG